MSKGLKIEYENNDIKVFYNKKQFFSFTYRKEHTVLGAQAISDTLLAVYKVKYHPKNIERLIKEALRGNKWGLRIEVVEKDKSMVVVRCSYNGKIIDTVGGYIEKEGISLENLSKDLARVMLKKGIKYNQENIKRLLKDAWRNRKVVPVVKSSTKKNQTLPQVDVEITYDKKTKKIVKKYNGEEYVDAKDFFNSLGIKHS